MFNRKSVKAYSGRMAILVELSVIKYSLQSNSKNTRNSVEQNKSTETGIGEKRAGFWFRGVSMGTVLTTVHV